MKKPTNINELVDQLLDAQAENRLLKKKLAALTQAQDEARGLSIRLENQTTKKSSFSNYEIKKAARAITNALTKIPFIK